MGKKREKFEHMDKFRSFNSRPFSGGRSF